MGSNEENHWKRTEKLQLAEVMLLAVGLVAAFVIGWKQFRVDQEQNEITKQLADHQTLKLPINRIDTERYQLVFEGDAEGSTDSYKFFDTRDERDFGCTVFQKKLYPQNSNSPVELNIKDSLQKYSGSSKPGNTQLGSFEIYFHAINSFGVRRNYKASAEMKIVKEEDGRIMDFISSTTVIRSSPPCAK